MSAHTPGPWQYVATEYPRGWLIEARDGTYTIAVVRDGSGSVANEANARLIAAAPELLEALILLEREMVASGNAKAADYGWKPAIEKTRAAIAKATGDAA
ncbi:hypothetical protein LDO31_02930 [Luteimonas sp. XNQY3]|nr:hypothetical protein [Luteimonas sp. XNQY3]MCD9005201.1 hypothetical protein [Luteimonas sp. XNQY3]